MSRLIRNLPRIIGAAVTVLTALAGAIPPKKKKKKGK
jgi:hypothetical protein